jgi:hypothetical protein
MPRKNALSAKMTNPTSHKKGSMMSLSFLKSVLIPVPHSGYVLLQKIYPPLAGLISFPDLFIQENP